MTILHAQKTTGNVSIMPKVKLFVLHSICMVLISNILSRESFWFHRKKIGDAPFSKGFVFVKVSNATAALCDSFKPQTNDCNCYFLPLLINTLDFCDTLETDQLWWCINESVSLRDHFKELTNLGIHFNRIFREWKVPFASHSKTLEIPRNPVLSDEGIVFVKNAYHFMSRTATNVSYVLFRTWIMCHWQEIIWDCLAIKVVHLQLCTTNWLTRVSCHLLAVTRYSHPFLASFNRPKYSVCTN